MTCIRLHISTATWQRIVLLAAALVLSVALSTVDIHSLKAPLHKLVLTQSLKDPSLGSNAETPADEEYPVELDPQWPLMIDIQQRPTKYAIGVLMVDEDLVTFSWMGDERLNDTTIFLVHDDDDFNSLREVEPRIYTVSISSNASKAAGFRGANFMARPSPSAWDKALYFFCRLSPKYEVVWLLENDVYIPSIDALIGTLSLPLSNDLVVKEHVSRKDDPGWLNWKNANLLFPEPRYKSMVCAVGFSKRLVAEFDNYVLKSRKIGFVETFFNSIAAHSNFTLLHPPTLQTLVWRHNWTCGDVKNSSMNWFHPVKDQESFNSECDFTY